MTEALLPYSPHRGNPKGGADSGAFLCRAPQQITLVDMAYHALRAPGKPCA